MPSPRWASAKVNRASRSGSGFGDGQGAGQRPSGGGRDPDPWASDAGGYSSEPPFGWPSETGEFAMCVRRYGDRPGRWISPEGVV